MADEELLIEVVEEVAIITINRESKMNSMSNTVRNNLLETLQKVGNNEDIKVIIITGAGEKVFISGAELSEVATNVTSPIKANEDALKGQTVTNMIERIPKPVIAAVNGAALGGGLEIILACDLSIASEKAVFGFPEVMIGLIPGWGGTQRITRTVGKKAAMQLVLLGGPLSASEAFRLGLVNEVVPGEQLLERSMKMAKRLMENSPIAMALAKKAVLEGMELSLDGGLQLEAALEGICFASEDKKEGVTSFLEKRKPKFTGK